MNHAISTIFLLLTIFSQASNGASIILYDASSNIGINPLSQGWTTTNIPLSYASNTTVNGIPAWQINDTGINIGDALAYSQQIPAQFSSLFNNGWQYQVRLNIPIYPTQPSEDFYVNTGTNVYATRVYRTSVGNLVIDNGALGQSYQTPVGNNDFYDVSLRYDPLTSKVNVFFDNKIAISDFLGLPSNQTLVQWGAGSSVETGIANWNKVEFSFSTPIPAAVWMVGSALVGLVGFVRRKPNQ